VWDLADVRGCPSIFFAGPSCLLFEGGGASAGDWGRGAAARPALAPRGLGVVSWFLGGQKYVDGPWGGWSLLRNAQRGTKKKVKKKSIDLVVSSKVYQTQTHVEVRQIFLSAPRLAPQASKQALTSCGPDQPTGYSYSRLHTDDIVVSVTSRSFADIAPAAAASVRAFWRSCSRCSSTFIPCAMIRLIRSAGDGSCDNSSE
jgi:hypothetical protein